MVNQTESHYDLIDQVGKEYLGITDDDVKKPRKRGPYAPRKSAGTGAAGVGGVGGEEVKRKPGPKKGWKAAQAGAKGDDTPAAKRRKGWSKERSGSVTVKRQSESPAP